MTQWSQLSRPAHHFRGDRGHRWPRHRVAELGAGRHSPSHALLPLANGKRPSVRPKDARAQGQLAHMLARAFRWDPQTATATTPGLTDTDSDSLPKIGQNLTVNLSHRVLNSPKHRADRDESFICMQVPHVRS